MQSIRVVSFVIVWQILWDSFFCQMNIASACKMRALTGIQPSGTAHLGNLFGAMLPAIQRAHSHESSVIFLADLHALTTVKDARKLQESTIDLAIDLLALGLNPDTTIFFKQSDVPQHCELAWILSTLAPMGLLQRAHSFKDKTAKGIDATAALFTYPILMSSDILLYSPKIVPVGKDQKQHLEIARDLAEKFNHCYGDTFLLPEPQISKKTAVVPGVDGQKMSKSYGNTIEIFADEKLLKKQIMQIVTDSLGVEDPKIPEGNTVFEIYKLFATKQEQLDFAEKFRLGGMGYGEAKKTLLTKANAFLEPLREKRREISKNPDFIQDVLSDGAKKAQKIAQKKLNEVKEKVGLLGDYTQSP